MKSSHSRYQIHSRYGVKKQQGIVIVIVTIAMITMLGVAALAIDINHAYMNRTKLQNGVDAAALSAAFSMDEYKGTSIAEAKANATTVANETLVRLTASAGNAEVDSVGADIAVTFNSSSDFTGADCVVDGDCYVRVAVSNLALESYFMRLFTDVKAVAASAVSGPSAGGGSCNVVPMAMCAPDPLSETGGYNDNNVYQLKLYSNSSEMGPGNFQLLNLDEGTLREQMAGSYEGCAFPGEDVTSKPGNTVGPVWQGLDTRFLTEDDIESGSGSNSVRGSYGPETDTRETPADELADNLDAIKEGTFNAGDADSLDGEGLSYNYSDYTGTGRRVLEVPIIECTGGETGASDYRVVTIGCYFLLRKPPRNSGQGQGALENAVYAEYMRDCKVQNSRNNGENSTIGTYRIVLYDDPFNEDS